MSFPGARLVRLHSGARLIRPPQQVLRARVPLARYLSVTVARTADKKEPQEGPEAPSDAPPEPNSFTSSTSEAAAAANEAPLPYLSRPLGVDKRPTSASKTWGERHAEWFDRDVRLEKRKAIVKDAARGYFHDFHEIRSHGGKTWRAPSTMIRHDKALYFPDIEGTCLADRSKKHTADLVFGRVSIVAIMTSRVSEVRRHG